MGADVVADVLPDVTSQLAASPATDFLADHTAHGAADGSAEGATCSGADVFAHGLASLLAEVATDGTADGATRGLAAVHGLRSGGADVPTSIAAELAADEAAHLARSPGPEPEAAAGCRPPGVIRGPGRFVVGEELRHERRPLGTADVVEHDHAALHNRRRVAGDGVGTGRLVRKEVVVGDQGHVAGEGQRVGDQDHLHARGQLLDTQAQRAIADAAVGTGVLAERAVVDQLRLHVVHRLVRLVVQDAVDASRHGLALARGTLVAQHRAPEVGGGTVAGKGGLTRRNRRVSVARVEQGLRAGTRRGGLGL